MNILAEFRSHFARGAPDHDWLVVQVALNDTLRAYLLTEPRVVFDNISVALQAYPEGGYWDTSVFRVGRHALKGEGRSPYEAAYDLLSRIPIAVEFELQAIPRPTVYERLLTDEDTDGPP